MMAIFVMISSFNCNEYEVEGCVTEQTEPWDIDFDSVLQVRTVGMRTPVPISERSVVTRGSKGTRNFKQTSPCPLSSLQ
jgi:hypothetical protein